ncbi:Inositol phoshorylceramide synthase regulatory subunit kei1 [Lachnellula suecica]|uniref:Inositol phoshorylceramide synthase regulatory subunit kei1 n=1 Tax=Lachnellula suecica TaxID=602035 RepID=A0A8T9C9W8_9HELO|nr:Inositol phoshorylceramide synthase regulatory subunit kei1 [Lachnellula suecica]
MVMMPRWLRLGVPKPRTFLGFLNLRIGVEMISLSMIFNKVTGFYGLLAILTGFRLSPLQFSMYIYSVGALVVLAFLTPHIRKQSPFQNLALAWFYLLDTVVNTAFTSAFAVTWFLAVSADQANTGIPSSAPGGSTIGDTAGFTNPTVNTSHVEVVTTLGKGIAGGQEAVAYAAAGGAAATASSPSLGHAVGIEESVPSMVVLVILTIIRIYFILVMMAYARQVLRQHVYSTSSTKLHLHTDGAADTTTDNPFAEASSEGQGWRGKLGRLMVGVGKGYWLGGQADEAWAKGLDGRFKATKLAGGPPGTLERERRARSGTGPPLPSPASFKL